MGKLKDRCRYQQQSAGVYLCVRNPDASGVCHGLCTKYESIVGFSPDYLCKECGQLLTSSESLNEAEIRNEMLIDFINHSLQNGFDEQAATTLVSDIISGSA